MCSLAELGGGGESLYNYPLKDIFLCISLFLACVKKICTHLRHLMLYVLFCPEARSVFSAAHCSVCSFCGEHPCAINTCAFALIVAV